MGCKSKAQNIALHKPYALSHAPNYKRAVPYTGETSLTDGKAFNEVDFVKDTSVLGWQTLPQVIININLEKSQTVKSISYYAFQNPKGNINAPSDVFVFLSEDDTHYAYAGNAATDLQNQTAVNQVKLILDNINQKAQYINLVIIPSGNLTFCDEIEVNPGNQASSKDKNITKAEITNVTDSLINIDYKKNQVLAELERAEKSNSTLTTNSFAALKAQIENSNASLTSLDSVYDTLHKLQAKKLQQKFNTPFVIETYNVWDSLSPYHFPPNQQQLSYDFTVPKNGVDYRAFVITNTTDLTQKFTFQFQSVKPEIAQIQLFNVPFIPASNFKMIPDPLMQITSDGISIEPGNSRMIICKVKGTSEGVIQPVILIDGKEKTVAVPTKIQVVVLNGFETDFKLNAQVWAYLNFPMLKDRKDQASIDLSNHHINVLMIPASILPKVGETDTKELSDYLDSARFAKKILIAPQFKAQHNKETLKDAQFLSDKWKANFLEWCKAIWETVRNHGFNNSQIYLFPYDEVRGNDIKDDVKLITWIKKAMPEIQIYSTIVGTNKEAIEAILPITDVAHIQEKTVPLNTISYPDSKAEKWLYKNYSQARSESPYKKYRLMAWEAFAYDFTGIGFWSYAMDSKQKFITDPFTNSNADFSVVYDGPGTSIVSSRRWEAFSLGIEDYQLLYLYSKKYGLQKAKEIVKQVINNPNNLDLADQARNKLLISLKTN